MLRIRRVGLALVAVFALSAVAASVASAALPEFTGPFPKAFTVTGGNISFESAGGDKWGCRNGTTGQGKIEDKKTGSVVLRLTECDFNGYGECQSVGANPYEITAKLLVKLGYIDKSPPKEVGMSFEAEAGLKANFFTEFTCTVGKHGAVVPFKTKGRIIGWLTPINGKTDTFHIEFTQSRGRQDVSKLEGQAESQLEMSVAGDPWETIGMGTTYTVLTEELTEIVA